MIGPQHIPLLTAYFGGMDATLSGKLLRLVPPDEPALTNELCALMDAETQRRERLPASGRRGASGSCVPEPISRKSYETFGSRARLPVLQNVHLLQRDEAARHHAIEFR